MKDQIWNFEIDTSPTATPLGIGADLVFCVRPPVTQHSVTLVVAPNVVRFSSFEEPSPGLEIHNLLQFTSTDETVEGTIAVGEANGRYFRLGPRNFRIALQAITNRTHEGQSFRLYHFLLVELESNAIEARVDEWKRLISEMNAAIAATDLDIVVVATASLAYSLEQELAPTSPIVSSLGHALINQAVALGELGQRERERATYNRLLALLPEQHPTAHEYIARALFGRAHSYGLTGEVDLAIGDYSEIARRYQNFPSLSAVTMVASALVNRAGLMLKAGRISDMHDAVANIVSRFEKREEPDIVAQVEKARQLLALPRVA